MQARSELGGRLGTTLLVSRASNSLPVRSSGCFSLDWDHDFAVLPDLQHGWRHNEVANEPSKLDSAVE